MTYWCVGELTFLRIEDEHLVKCDLWVGRLNWPTGSMSCSSWLLEHFGSVAWPQHTVHIPLVAMTADKGQLTGSASGEVSGTFGVYDLVERKR
jgi:hypothetical protein